MTTAGDSIASTVPADSTPVADTPPSLTSSDPPVIVSSYNNLSQAVYERRADYIRTRKLNVKVGSWNVAALSGTEKDIKEWFVESRGLSADLSGLKINEPRSQNHADIPQPPESFDAQEDRYTSGKPSVPIHEGMALPNQNDISIYALGLQEIIDISSPASIKPFGDAQARERWKLAVSDALPSGFQMIAEQQLMGLYLLIFAAEDIVGMISNVSTTSVGTGFMGYVGNKGAVAARIVLGETTSITFINCHLAAGADKSNLERRNWDASQIQARTKFDSVADERGLLHNRGDNIGDEDFAFWFGDLNYRLEDMPAEDVRRLLMLHTKNEYNFASTSRQKINDEISPIDSVRSSKDSLSFSTDDGMARSVTSEISNETSPTDIEVDEDPSQDPTSLQTTLSSLFAHDELHKQMHHRKAFGNGWREGPITFLPTYKYDVGSVAVFDSSEKRRGPSWCDRILYRTRKDTLEHERTLQEDEQAKAKDAELKKSGVVDAASDEDVLFDYDPEADGAEYDESEQAENLILPPVEGFSNDRLNLKHYVSHQRVLSSDHKPLDAVFQIEYDAVDIDLRTKVQQEIARELDKAENDGRPAVTIVFDPQQGEQAGHWEHDSSFDGIDFGPVQYLHNYTRLATIANTGRVPATIGFADRSVEAGKPGIALPPWLAISFDRPAAATQDHSRETETFVLQTGEALNFELCLKVHTFDLVRSLNDGDLQLEDILLLRIQNGRDYFLPVKARWLPTVFGMTIDQLVRLPDGGIVNLPDSKKSWTDNSNAGEVKRSAPREFFQLTEAIEILIERAIGEWEMRGEDRSKLGDEMAGWPFKESDGHGGFPHILTEKIVEALDTETNFSDIWPAETSSLQRLEAVSQVLFLLLQSLADGVITSTLWNQIEYNLIRREKTKVPMSAEEERAMILEILSASPAHSVSFTFITFTLSRVANEVAPLRSETPTSPSQAFRDALSEQLRTQDATGARRRRVETAYATIFADVMIRSDTNNTGNKARKATDTLKRHVLEVFLSGYS